MPFTKNKVSKKHWRWRSTGKVNFLAISDFKLMLKNFQHLPKKMRKKKMKWKFRTWKMGFKVAASVLVVGVLSTLCVLSHGMLLVVVIKGEAFCAGFFGTLLVAGVAAECATFGFLGTAECLKPADPQ